MSGAVIRDADDMERFAEALSQFEDDVKQLCDKMQGTLSDANQFMRDENSTRALIKMSETFDEIKAELPSCSGMRVKLKTSARYIREANSALRR